MWPFKKNKILKGDSAIAEHCRVNSYQLYEWRREYTDSFPARKGPDAIWRANSNEIDAWLKKHGLTPKPVSILSLLTPKKRRTKRHGKKRNYWS